MGFCAGAYYASTRLEFEIGTPIEVSGSRELGFFPGIARGTAFKGFKYSSNDGERPALCSIEPSISVSKSFHAHYNGGPTFVDADKFSNVEILSKYLEKLDVDPGSGDAAVVYCKVGKGAAILFGSHVEFDCTLLKYSTPKKDDHLLKTLDASFKLRDVFLEHCFDKLGLRVNKVDELKVPKLTPLMLSSLDPEKVEEIVTNVTNSTGFEDEAKTTFKGPYYTFKISDVKDSDTSPHVKMDESDDYEDPQNVTKELWVFKNGDKPYPRLTPYFNISSYYAHLKEAWASEMSNLYFGETLLYGEILTSTNTLLEKNHKVLNQLPEGFTAIGTTQVSGRGRGGNVWVSPMGTLAISTVVRMTMDQAKLSPIIFTQYLTSMAMVDAVLTYGSGYEDLPIRLKWPNDIYIMKPEFIETHLKNRSIKYTKEIEPIYAKIGGLLINTVIQDNKYVLIIGCGTNVSNAGPTTSLNLVLDKMNDARVARNLEPLPSFTVEKLAARYMLCLEKLFQVFKSAGFSPLLPKYYRHWLHSEQIVTLGSMGSLKARVKGISSNYGYMVVEELDANENSTGKKYELQPDGNSFDMMKGLITKKHL